MSCTRLVIWFFDKASLVTNFTKVIAIQCTNKHYHLEDGVRRKCSLDYTGLAIRSQTTIDLSEYLLLYPPTENVTEGQIKYTISGDWLTRSTGKVTGNVRR